MKILLIGSKGFIGSHAFRSLSEDHEVWGCDVVTDYVTPRYVQVDATNADFKEIFQAHTFDACLNCAGAASVPDSFHSPFRDITLNTLLVAKILEAIRLHGKKCKFVNMSSAAVYGNPIHLPIKEHIPLHPLSPYGYHKKYAEEIVKEYAIFFEVACCSLRPFSVYGPGLRKQLFWDLHTKVQASSHIELWGTGEESRDFIYVEDVVNVLRCVLKNGLFKGECINVANGKEITIRETVSCFQEVYFKPFTFSFGGQKREGDPLNWEADITTLIALGYIPTTNLKQGLTYLAEWLRLERK